VIFPGERDVIRSTILAGRSYGYGNLIAALKWAWARRLMADGLETDVAKEGADTNGYDPTMPLPHGGLDDLMEETP